jgi:hypothetical protein
MVELETYSKLKIKTLNKSVKRLNQEGRRVLLFFMRYLGCVYTQGLIHDIYQTEKELLKLNIIPVMIFQEEEIILKYYFEEKPKYNHLHYMCDDKNRFRKIFEVNLVDSSNTIHSSSISEIIRLKNEGISQIKKYTPKKKSIHQLLSASFLIQELKIIREYKYERPGDRLDIFSFIVDPYGLCEEIESVSICEIGLFQSNQNIKFVMENKRISKVKEEEMVHSLDEIFSKEEQQENPMIKRMMTERKSIIVQGINKMRSESDLSNKELKIESYSLSEDLNVVKKEKKKKFNFFKSSFVDQEDEIIYPRYDPKNIEYTLEDVLTDENFFPFFKIFLSILNLSELFICYEEILYFQKKLKNKKKEFISNFFLIFFDPESIHYLNLSELERKKFNDEFRDQIEKNEELDGGIFDSILKDLNHKFNYVFEGEFKDSIYYQIMIEMRDEESKRNAFVINI